jgi:phosphoribosylamine--glycine ligase
MRKYGIPTAAYAVFDDPLKAESYIRRKDSFPVVIKADGLALGKGVVIAQSMDEALVALKSIMQDQVFGASGNQIVIEDYLTGPEVTVLAFADGDTIIPMVSSMDHKRALEGNRGLNTGGMGTIAPNPHYSADIASVCMEKIFLPTIRAMKDEGCPFKGCLYFGLMLTPRGPMVIEYNCRFGDPEAQVVLPLLETDLFEIMQAVTDTKLAALDIKWKDAHAACVILASGGYPEEYTTGYPINGLDDKGDMPGAAVYHAGTQYKDGQFLTAGGRVLGVTCTAANLSDALDAAYGAVSRISFKDAFFRRDIGRY